MTQNKNTKRLARTKAVSTNDEDDWTNFRRNECTRYRGGRHLTEVYKNLETEKDTGKLYSTTRKLLGWNKQGPPSSFLVDGILVKKQQQIANHQADYYDKKIKEIKNKIPQVNIDPLGQLKRIFGRWIRPGRIQQFELKLTSEKEIGELISKLKNSKAYGIDRIDATIFKMFASHLIPPVTHVVNLSLKNSKFPARWKLARILPLLKGKGIPLDNPSSFRPVSQLPVTSKLTERVVQRQLLTLFGIQQIVVQQPSRL